MKTEQIKVVMIGEARVGKSSLLMRYVANTFNEYMTPTLGAAYHTRGEEVNGVQVKLNIWDTAGQERYHSLAKLYTRDARVIVLVYDITDRSSFIGMQRWYDCLQKEGLPKDLVFGVFGNKEDLVQDEKVSLEEAKTFAAGINAVYAKTSAKLNTGIEEGFRNLSIEVLLRSDAIVYKESFRLTGPTSQKPRSPVSKSSGCCSS